MLSVIKLCSLSEILPSRHNINIVGIDVRIVMGSWIVYVDTPNQSIYWLFMKLYAPSGGHRLTVKECSNTTFFNINDLLEAIPPIALQPSPFATTEREVVDVTAVVCFPSIV